MVWESNFKRPGVAFLWLSLIALASFDAWAALSPPPPKSFTASINSIDLPSDTPMRSDPDLSTFPTNSSRELVRHELQPLQIRPMQISTDTARVPLAQGSKFLRNITDLSNAFLCSKPLSCKHKKAKHFSHTFPNIHLQPSAEDASLLQSITPQKETTSYQPLDLPSIPLTLKNEQSLFSEFSLSNAPIPVNPLFSTPKHKKIRLNYVPSSIQTPLQGERQLLDPVLLDTLFPTTELVTITSNAAPLPLHFSTPKALVRLNDSDAFIPFSALAIASSDSAPFERDVLDKTLAAFEAFYTAPSIEMDPVCIDVKPVIQSFQRLGFSPRCFPLLAANYSRYKPILSAEPTPGLKEASQLKASTVWYRLYPAAKLVRHPSLSLQVSVTPLTEEPHALTNLLLPSLEAPDHEPVFSIRAPTSIMLEPLPIEIVLPTLSTIKFYMSYEPIPLATIDPIIKDFSALSICAKLAPILTHAIAAPAQQGSHFLRPHLIDFAPPWLDNDAHIAPVVLTGYTAHLPKFNLLAVPDTRILAKLSKDLDSTISHAHPKLAFNSLFSEAISMALPKVSKKVHSKQLQALFSPSQEPHEPEVIANNRIQPLTPCQNRALPFISFYTTDLDSRAFIDDLPPTLHPSSAHPITAHLEIALIRDAKKRHEKQPRPVTGEHYIRKYGHYPNFEPIAKALSYKGNIPVLDIAYSVESSPYLWDSDSYPLVLYQVSDSLKDLRIKSGASSNRTHRCVATNLSALPTLYELETSSYDTEFSTSVAWIPKSTGKRYLFAITIKPIDSARFERLQQHIHFVIDNSQAVDKAKLSAYKSAIQRALPYIHTSDTFNIAHYGDDLAFFSPSSLPVTANNKAAVRNYLSMLNLYYPFKKTNTYQLLTALSKKLKAQNGLHTVILFTDGQSLTDLPKKSLIAKELVQENQHDFNLYPVCVGGGNQYNHLRMLSTLQRGNAHHIQNLVAFPRKFAAYVKKLNEPIARDVHIVALAANSKNSIQLFSEAPRVPALYRNKPLVIYGEADSLEPFSVMIQARLANRFVNVQKTISFDPTQHPTPKLFEQCNFDLKAFEVNACFNHTSRESLEQANTILRTCKF